jgi:hypothetical protein
MNPLTGMNNFLGKNKNLLGILPEKSIGTNEGFNNKSEKKIKARRAMNKVAYKSRRKNVIMAGSKKCKVKC